MSTATYREVWNELYGESYDQLITRAKDNAKRLLRYHLKKGHVKRLVCEYSGCAQSRAQAHHADYNHPLDVIWLCAEHHKELHRGLRSLAVL